MNRKLVVALTAGVLITAVGLAIATAQADSTQRRMIWTENTAPNPQGNPWDTVKTEELKRLIQASFSAPIVTAGFSQVSVTLVEPNPAQAYRDAARLCQAVFSKYPFVTSVNFIFRETTAAVPMGRDAAEATIERSNEQALLTDPTQFRQLASRYDVLFDHRAVWGQSK